jgi:adenosylcobinamide kinase / adenosylcobinamide-phosphate guanylyltransferase
VGRVVLILGGARSGKSTLAERMAAEAGGRVTFIATAEAGDGEMARRIEAHRAARPPVWRTVEEPLDLPGAVMSAGECDVLVVDCLTVWTSNHLCRIDAAESSPEWSRAAEGLLPALEAQLAEFVRTVRESGATALVVSNEVGMGLVPATLLGRAYRDLLGFVNRRVAEGADQVLLVVAGLAVDVKRLSEEMR